MEAEIISSAHSCRELFPIIDMENSLGKAIVLLIGDTTMNVLFHKYNVSDLVLARTLSPQFTPHSKFYVAKTTWFCEEINK